MSQPDDRIVVRLHQLLLRVAGWAPDDVVSSARGWLADGRLSDAARAALGTVLADRVPIRPDDAELLVGLLADVPQVALLAGGVPATEGQHPAYDFAPVLPGPFDAGPAPLLLDLTRPGAPELSPADAAAVAALGQVAEPVALWRVWRSPQEDRVAGGPVPVYLLETAGDAVTLPGATAWLQDTLTRAGLPDPQVEVFAPGVDLPAYQRLARGRSALLWAGAAAPPPRIARVYDSFDPVLGGQFTVDHPVLSAGDERERVLDYLDSGQLLLATTAREGDVFDLDAGPTVPMSFRTDGSWIWTDTVAYYLRTYALSPDVELLAHIRERDYTYREPDAVAGHRALAQLHAPG